MPETREVVEKKGREFSRPLAEGNLLAVMAERNYAHRPWPDHAPLAKRQLLSQLADHRW